MKYIYSRIYPYKLLDTVPDETPDHNILMYYGGNIYISDKEVAKPYVYKGVLFDEHELTPRIKFRLKLDAQYEMKEDEIIKDNEIIKKEDA